MVNKDIYLVRSHANSSTASINYQAKENGSRIPVDQKTAVTIPTY